MTRAPLIVLSGPSGAGKTTVVDALLKEAKLPLRRAITATTRAPRPGELDGRDYHFWSVERFQKAIDAGEMLEHAKVHTDYYGTPRAAVDPVRAAGVGVILVIDVQGAEHVRALYPGDHVSIFLNVPEKGMLRDRLEFRGDSEAKIQTRLRTAEAELKRVKEFEHVVINDDLPNAIRDLTKIIEPLFPVSGAA